MAQRFRSFCSSWWMRVAVVLLPALPILLWSLHAFARAGGGQHYSGGSHSSGGGSSGGGGGGDAAIVWFLVNICIEYPPLGIVVVSGIVVFAVVSHVRNPSRTTRKALEKLASENISRNIDELAQILHRDPGFQLESFINRARAAVERVNQVWSAGSMVPARGLISDAVFIRFQTQIRLLAAQGLRNRVADFVVTDAQAVAVESDGAWDTIHVKITAQARDLDLPVTLPEDKVAAKLSAASCETFYEIWSFTRRVGAQTLAQGGILEGRCPECGANVPPAETIKCEYCKAIVNSGMHDWVLAEITQIVEWEAASSGESAIAGFDELKARDPELNRQSIEDRASVLFWKWLAARVTGDAQGLGRYSLAPLEQLGITPGAAHPLYRVAVGAADLLACDVAPTEGCEHCYVRIKWSAAATAKDQALPTVNVLILARREAVVTSPGRMTLTCHVCRGPLDESDDPRCRYCDAEIGPGEQEWALEQVTSPLAAERVHAARAAGGAAGGVVIDLPDLADPAEREILFGLIVGVVLADGVVTSGERRLLQGYARRWSIPKARVEAMLAGGTMPALNATGWHIAPEDRLPLLNHLVAAALVDGRIDRQERKLLNNVAGSLQIAPTELENLIKAQDKT